MRCSDTPPAWADAQGKTVETQYSAFGFACLNVHAQTFQLLQRTGDTLLLTERPHSVGLLSRVYHVEHVTYTEYSDAPRRWCERTDPTTAFYFEEVRRIVPEKK